MIQYLDHGFHINYLLSKFEGFTFEGFEFRVSTIHLYVQGFRFQLLT